MAALGTTEPTKAPCEPKAAPAWQAEQWKKWPTIADWPGVLDIYEAAALRRVHPCTIRDACRVAKRGIGKGTAKLPHSRWGSSYRINKDDVLAYGRVPTVAERQRQHAA